MNLSMIMKLSQGVKSLTAKTAVWFGWMNKVIAKVERVADLEFHCIVKYAAIVHAVIAAIDPIVVFEILYTESICPKVF